jgi:hypothetical protein
VRGSSSSAAAGNATFPAIAGWSKPGRTLSTPLRADHARSGRLAHGMSRTVRRSWGVIGYRVDSARPGYGRLWIAGKVARGR